MPAVSRFKIGSATVLRDSAAHGHTCRSLCRRPIVLPQPKYSSIRLRLRWLTAYPACRVVLPSTSLLNRRAWMFGNVRCDMRRESELACILYKRASVVALVRAERATARRRLKGRQHLQRCIALGVIARSAHCRGDNQVVPVIRQGRSQITQCGRCALALGRQMRIGIRARNMSLVRALLAAEIHRWIARVIILPGRFRRVPRHKTLVTRARFEEGAIHRKVIMGEETALFGRLQHTLQECLGNVALRCFTWVAAGNPAMVWRSWRSGTCGEGFDSAPCSDTAGV